MNGRQDKQVLILLANKFDEPFVVNFICRLRDSRIAAQMAGLTSGLIQGIHGLTLRPELSLLEISEQPLSHYYQAIVIPGGRHCAKKLLTDPRVHRLLTETYTSRGLIAMTVSAHKLLEDRMINDVQNSENFLYQGNRSDSEFTDSIIAKLSM